MTERRFLWLIIQATYTLADGTKRVYSLSGISRTDWSGDEVARWRAHQFRRFDHDFPRELQRRGEFYGSTIGGIRSTEEVRSYAHQFDGEVTVSDA